MTLSLRPAQARDIDAVGAMHYASRLAAYRDFVPLDGLRAMSAESLTAWWRERFRYESDTHRLTIALAGDRPVGFTYVGPDEDDDRVAQLYAIHLDPAEQGQGYGRALMRDALAAMRAAGWREAVLWVLAGNGHARRFYERGGWAPDGAEREELVGAAPTRQLRYRRWLGESA